MRNAFCAVVLGEAVAGLGLRMARRGDVRDERVLEQAEPVPDRRDAVGLLRANGGLNAAYRLRDVRAKKLANGTILVTGRATFARGTPPPPVVLFTYRLSGRITDAGGQPVAGASVVTRTLDRNFWTFSQPSDSQGNYTSFFTASDQLEADPVPMNVQVALGDTSYAFATGKSVTFKRLRSATMDIRLPASGPMAVPETTSYVGGVYDGLLIGVARADHTVRPVSATWPDGQGRFRLVLPSSVRGKTVSFWMDQRQTFSRAVAGPGLPVTPGIFPSTPRPQAPQGLLRIRLPR